MATYNISVSKVEYQLTQFENSLYVWKNGEIVSEIHHNFLPLPTATADEIADFEKQVRKHILIKLTKFGLYVSKAKESLQLARTFQKLVRCSWATALRYAWKKIKAIATKKITFVKLGETISTTRNVGPIEKYTGFRDNDPKFPLLFRFIDLDKLAVVNDPKQAIIAVYLNRVL